MPLSFGERFGQWRKEKCQNVRSDCCTLCAAELWKTDTAITIMITQKCLNLKRRKSDISSKDRISEELVKLLQLRQKTVNDIPTYHNPCYKWIYCDCTQYHKMDKSNQFRYPTMGSNWNSAVLIWITEFVSYGIKSLTHKSKTIKNLSITDTESVRKTQGLCHCSKPEVKHLVSTSRLFCLALHWTENMKSTKQQLAVLERSDPQMTPGLLAPSSRAWTVWLEIVVFN